MEGKNIKVYGTLINQTLNTNSSMRDSQHNDLIAVAYQLYDERFNPRKGSGTNFAVTAIDRYQDIINKRLTAIYFDDKGTGNTSDDITYIDSKLNVAGDSVFEGPVTFNNNVNIGLDDLNDVTLSTMAVGQVLRYDGSKWVNTKLSLSDLLMPTASNGLILKFNGTEWVAGTDESGASLNLPLSSINNAGLSTPSAANDILMWNGSAWVYTTIDAISFVDSDIDNTPRTLKQWITYLNTAIGNSNMWEADTNNANLIRPKNSKAVTAPGFYDSSISAS